MKFIFIFLAIAIFSIACSNRNPSPDLTATDSLQNNAALSTDSATAEGARLIAANDCLTCHQVDKKTIGPSYVEIAERYENNAGNVSNLIHSIVHGSKGKWGEQQMTPHPNLDQQDAAEMVNYILSLRSVSTP